MTPIIKIEHLSAGYDGKQVLSNVNLTVYQDDYLGIIGPNGGGKTTLMRLILGLKKPTEGTIRYFRKVKDENGKTVLDENGEAKVEETKEISMGYLPQYNQLDKQFLSLYMKLYLPDSARPKVSFHDTPRHSTSRCSIPWNACS